MAILAVCYASAHQERETECRVVVDIPFTLSGADRGDIRLDLDSVGLVKSIRELKLLSTDHTSVIKSVVFYSSVSPEGSIEANKRLGKERLETTEQIVREIIDLADSIDIVRDERYIPWHDYLLPAIQADKSVPYREELMKLIYREPGSTHPDNRRVDLKLARDGALWDVVEKRYFKHMRKGGAIITVTRKISNQILGEESPMKFGVSAVEADALDFTVPVEEVVAEPAPEPAGEAPHAISIKTNLAACSALITNIGTEIKLAPRWSLDIIGAYSPYNMIVKDRKIRLFGIRPEARFWWGTPMHRGHFIGLHGFTSAFNVQLGDKVRYQDPNHALWGVGVAYGYALPLGKRERLGLEFTIGLGYARVKYDKYDGAINGQFIERKTINYFGPTRLGINLSYRFDIDKRRNQR